VATNAERRSISLDYMQSPGLFYWYDTVLNYCADLRTDCYLIGMADYECFGGHSDRGGNDITGE
jgi:hypothetical protein